MQLYKLWQDDNNGYETYDSAVICAESITEAKDIAEEELGWAGSWTSKEKVKFDLIGRAFSNVKKGLIVASFNAG